MFDPGSSAGGTISSSEHDLEMLTALRFGSRFVDRRFIAKTANCIETGHSECPVSADLA